jgi:hypothetical protein
MHREEMISIWFFIGLLLLAYGVLIAGSGIYELFSPPAHPVVMADLHTPIWWGALLLTIGAVYSIRFAPKRKR